jgi:multiple antibiotic resistance protein
MWEAAAIAAATFFATVGPFDVAAVYAALSANAAPADKRRMACKGVLIAALILLSFAIAGEALLRSLGISQAAFRAAGGVLLLLIGINLVFARNSGGGTTTDAENRDAASRGDLAVFPVAMPLIAGPGTMGAVILHIADAEGDFLRQLAVLAALALVLLLTLASMLLANQLHRLLGVTGMHVVSRVFGVILTAMAVQFIFDGLSASGILSPSPPA